MKLKNKKTGEIVEATDFNIIDDYATLAELNEEWEDYEEPKEYCYITNRGNFLFIEDIDGEDDKERKEIGNHFETREEAEKAVEKLKAWKRLKDAGFEFRGIDWKDRGSIGDFEIYAHADGEILSLDLDFLFGD